jgi:hypothetical protein
LCERDGRERPKVEEGADKQAWAVSHSGKEERAAAVARPIWAGPARKKERKRARGSARRGWQQAGWADWAGRREGEEKKFFLFLI